MSFDPTTCAVLACDVFQDELLKFGKGKDWRHVEFLEMGLHDQPAILREEIQRVINRLQSNIPVNTILLLYGICGNGLIGVESARCRLVLPRAHDCISILLGGPDIHQAVLKKNPGTYFYSPGWIRGKRVPGPDRDAHMLKYYSEKYPDDEELVADLIDADQETFAHHNCAAYVDITGDRSAESYCEGCAKSLGWAHEKLPGDPRLLQDLLNGNWDDSRFLVLEPPARISRVLDNQIQGIQG